MKITRIAAYQVDLPVREGSYNWSGGKSVSVFDSTVVRVETDAGASPGSKQSALPPRIGLHIAVENPNGYLEAQNQRSSRECRTRTRNPRR